MGTPVGKINFFLGEVQMKDNQNLAYKTATMNAVVHQEGYVKTGPDASLEIKWTNGCVSKVDPNKQLSIAKLLEEANANPNWRNKLANKASGLKLQSKQSAKSVAGIRRDEVEVKKESSLFWYTETPLVIDDAIAFFDNKNYTSAIPIFEGVIEQGPLKRDAELAHTYLILIYDELGDKTKMKQHVETLKADFPESSTLDSLPPDK
jgi:tetratricopeptide (TPR) repeat protein